ncbi:hypothetical protein B0H15DRAFT_844217, partial [Mycena belliarum]
MLQTDSDARFALRSLCTTLFPLRATPLHARRLLRRVEPLTSLSLTSAFVMCAFVTSTRYVRERERASERGHATLQLAMKLKLRRRVPAGGRPTPPHTCPLARSLHPCRIRLRPAANPNRNRTGTLIAATNCVRTAQTSNLGIRSWPPGSEFSLSSGDSSSFTYRVETLQQHTCRKHLAETDTTSLAETDTTSIAILYRISPQSYALRSLANVQHLHFLQPVHRRPSISHLPLPLPPGPYPPLILRHRRRRRRNRHEIQTDEINQSLRVHEYLYIHMTYLASRRTLDSGLGDAPFQLACRDYRHRRRPCVPLRPSAM